MAEFCAQKKGVCGFRGIAFEINLYYFSDIS